MHLINDLRSFLHFRKENKIRKKKTTDQMGKLKKEEKEYENC